MNQKRVRSTFFSYLCYNTANGCSRSFTSGVANALNVCIIAGSTRTNGPPRPILSDRVTSYIQSSVSNRPSQHSITTIQSRGNLPLLERPHFAYPKSQVPEELSSIFETLTNADAYIIITPEYNHSPCPGLMNLMNHFGSSTFGFKPSAIVSYSAGQWGGTRAAHSLRPFLSELGCLPVSAMVHIPKVADVLGEDGNLMEGASEERWSEYVERMMNQLEWWGQAAKEHREVQDPFEKSPAFLANPSQRNAPN